MKGRPLSLVLGPLSHSGAGISARPVLSTQHSALSTEQGVTLLELLVAVTLLGLVSLGLLFSLRIGSSAWQRGNARLLADRRVVAAADLLSVQLAGAQARRVVWGPDGRQARLAYFDGAPDRLRFLTSYSLEAQSRGGLWMAAYFFARAEEGTCELFYNERPFQDDADVASTIEAANWDATRGRWQIVFAPAKRDAHTRVLYRGLKECHFEYLIEPPSGPAHWGSEWEADENLVPRAAAARFIGTESRGIAPVAMVATIHAREVRP